MLELKDVEKVYKIGDNVVHALKGVSLRIDKGDYVAIMGPSGSGKSTLMHVLGLLDVPTNGSYKINGNEVAGLSEDDLAILRREEIGFIFQQFNLLPRMSAFENVALPLFYTGKENETEYAKTLLERVGLGQRMEHRSNELSGGQQQRVAIARSLVNRPQMILADEPTGNLDSTSEKEIMTILRELNESGITVVIVTHEEEIGRQAKRLIRMRDGVIQSDERVLEFSLKNADVPGAGAAAKSGFSWLEVVEYFKQGFKTLGANKVRTGLSMLGIMIGVAAVVAMLALGRGAQKAIEDQLSSLGSNLLVLRPGAMRVGGVAQQQGATTRISYEDVAGLKANVQNLVAVSAFVSGRAQLTYKNKNWSTQVQGTGVAYPQMHDSVPQAGRFFTTEEDLHRSAVAVIGATIVKELFGEQNPLGEMIKINKVNFLVIGVLPTKGASGWRDQDDTVLIPTLTAMHRLMGKIYVDNVELQIADVSQLESAQDQILAYMFKRHRVAEDKEEEAFEIRNMADIQAALSQSSKTMSLLLSSIAAISLLVGGIGIMNIMLVSVTERTREIGLRKAIGAMKWNILAQFLAESVVVSVAGGFFGIVLAWLITVAIAHFTGWSTSISMSSIFLAVGFSAGIGLIFGIYPAKKASQLHPIEALRYE
jgi:macrolide transport system ATP-binding/permease protein